MRAVQCTYCRRTMPLATISRHLDRCPHRKISGIRSALAEAADLLENPGDTEQTERLIKRLRSKTPWEERKEETEEENESRDRVITE